MLKGLQQMDYEFSFLRFLIYGWIGWIIYPMIGLIFSPLLFFKYSIQTFSFREGIFYTKKKLIQMSRIGLGYKDPRKKINKKNTRIFILLVLWSGCFFWAPSGLDLFLGGVALLYSIVFFLTWGSGDDLWDSDSESGD